MIRPFKDIIDEESESSEHNELNSALIHKDGSDHYKSTPSHAAEIVNDSPSEDQSEDEKVDPEQAATILFNDIFSGEFSTSQNAGQLENGLPYITKAQYERAAKNVEGGDEENIAHMLSLYDKAQKKGKVFEERLRDILLKDVQEFILGIEQKSFNIGSPISNNRSFNYLFQYPDRRYSIYL